MENNLVPEQKIMFLSVKVNPLQSELNTIDEQLLLVADWTYFLRLLIDRGVAPLFYVKLPLLRNKNVVPQNVQNVLMQTYYKVMSRNMLLYKVLKEVIDLLDANNIKVVLLKGMYVAEHFYKDIALRQTSDIDLLVEEKDGLRAHSLIKTLGFSNIWSEISGFVGDNNYKVHYSPLVREDVLVEVHHRLHKESPDYALRVQDMIDNSELTTVSGVKVLVFNIFDTLIYTCVHSDKHLQEGYTQFTGYFDITNILAAYGDKFDWEKFTERCRFHSCELAVFGQIMLAVKYFYADVPAQIREKYANAVPEKYETLIFSLLSGDTNDIKVGVYEYYARQHFANIKSLHSVNQKIHYLKDVLFPPKSFMITKYCPQNPQNYRIYYFYRYYRGLKGLFHKPRHSHETFPT
jgi:predicted nucleotidyltransferase